MEGWNASSLLEPAAAWGGGFCQAHHVGFFCQGFTRVRCCRNTWGFVQCGSSVHYRGCGWHAGGWHGGWHHFNQIAENETQPQAAEEYLEEPDEAEAERPKPAMEGWNASSLLEPAAAWGGGFCQAHHVGFFCLGRTRVRCCRKTWGFVQCGSSVHYRACGWRRALLRGCHFAQFRVCFACSTHVAA